MDYQYSEKTLTFFVSKWKFLKEDQNYNHQSFLKKCVTDIQISYFNDDIFKINYI